MQPDPVEIVTAIYAAWNAGDWALEHFHPDVEWELMAEGSIDEAGASSGRDSLLDYWKRFWEAWQAGAFWDIEAFERIGEDRLVACGRLNARGRSSGVEVSTPVFHGWRVREGVVDRLVVGADRAAAMRGVGY
jgi:ketosteroid isomerase-like protein